jgi:putative copper resistance protein D
MAGMISAALITSRLLHFTALMLLFGAPLFSLYVVPREGTPDEMELVRRLNSWLHRLITGAVGLALVSGVALLGCTAAAMSGDPMAAWKGDTLRLVLFNTRFGAVWQWQFAIAVLLLLFCLCVRSLSRKRLAVVVALSGALLVTAASIGHASMGSGTARFVHLLNQSVHLTAAATWVGGLLPLGFVLAGARRPASEPWASLARRALSRFSQVGTLAVALLLATGIVNSSLFVGSLLGTLYGHILLVKICLFTIMASLALTNRLWLMPRIEASPALPGEGNRAMTSVWRNVLAEQGLGLLVLAVVSILGTLPPGGE